VLLACHWKTLPGRRRCCRDDEKEGRDARDTTQLGRGVAFVGEVAVTSTAEAVTYFRGPDGYLYALWKPRRSVAV